MPLLASTKSTGPKQLPPSGTHVARCYSVIDLGTHDKTWQGQTKRKHEIRVSWELPNETADFGKGKPEPFAVHKQYTLSLSDKSVLRHDLKTWRGRDFTEAELAGFDVFNVLGAACMVTIEQVDKNGTNYANVTAVTAVPKVPGPDGKPISIPVAPPINPPFKYAISEHDDLAFATLPQFLREQVESSYEFKARKVVESQDPIPMGEPEPDHEWSGDTQPDDPF